MRLRKQDGIELLRSVWLFERCTRKELSALQEIAGGYAYLVDPMDVDAIAGGIVVLTTDERVREDFRELGKKRALDFNWDKAAERTLEVYAAALRGEAARKSGIGSRES